MTNNLFDTIRSALHNEDVEGFIATGAPEDEYDSEAQFLTSIISTLESEDLGIDNIAKIVAQVWAESFNRDTTEIEMRMPAFQRIATRILAIQ